MQNFKAVAMGVVVVIDYFWSNVLNPAMGPPARQNHGF
jgi:hypothetical protein